MLQLAASGALCPNQPASQPATDDSAWVKTRMRVALFLLATNTLRVAQ